MKEQTIVVTIRNDDLAKELKSKQSKAKEQKESLLEFIEIIFLGLIAGAMLMSVISLVIPVEIKVEAVECSLTSDNFLDTYTNEDWAAALIEPITTSIPVPIQMTQPTEEYTFTAYCSCEKCCEAWANKRPKDENGKDIVKGAGNVQLISGYHCASPLPFGTIIETETGRVFEVQDRTSKWVADKYDNKIIDVFFDKHEDAVSFGKSVKKVTIISEGESK